MRVDMTDIRGVRLEEARVHTDHRGNFVKYRDAQVHRVPIDQVCSSFNHRAGTVRGIHVQVPPHVEHKLVWCTAGAIWDLVVDTRHDEPTYGHWAATELSADAPSLLHVPAGVAHGYQTLTDSAAVAYLIEGRWVPTAARTISWEDPALAIDWPHPISDISDADKDGLAWPIS